MHYDLINNVDLEVQAVQLTMKYLTALAYVLMLMLMSLVKTRLKGRLFTLPIILCKQVYCTNATKCVMRYKLVPHYIFDNTGIIRVFENWR